MVPSVVPSHRTLPRRTRNCPKGTRKSENAKGTRRAEDRAGTNSPVSVGFRVFALSRFRVLRSAAFASSRSLSVSRSLRKLAHVGEASGDGRRGRHGGADPVGAAAAALAPFDGAVAGA